DLSVATGDVNGDGTSDIVVARGYGASPTVDVYNGKTFAQIGTGFDAFPSAFIGGVSLAAADVNGDGKADIVVGAGPGGGPNVKVVDGTNDNVLMSFFAFDPTYMGGVSVASADVNGDGKADIAVGSAGNRGPVRVFSGKDGSLLQSFFAFD